MDKAQAYFQGACSLGQEKRKQIVSIAVTLGRKGSVCRLRKERETEGDSVVRVGLVGGPGRAGLWAESRHPIT